MKIRREQAGHLVNQKSISQSAFFAKRRLSILSLSCKAYKKVTELINVSTFTACQTIKRAATIHLLLGVNDDLMAAEVKYHKNCYSLYTAKKVREDKGESSNKSHHKNAFKQLVEELRPGLEQGRAYDIASLLIKYRDYLSEKGVPGDGYTSQRLKDRLKSSFGEEITFHQQLSKAKLELIYWSNVKLQDVINAWAITQSNQVNNNSITQIWFYVCIGNSMVFGINTTSDISKLLHKYGTILKYHQ